MPRQPVRERFEDRRSALADDLDARGLDLHHDRWTLDLSCIPLRRKLGHLCSADASCDCTNTDTKIAVIAAIAKAMSIGPNHLIAFVGSMDLSNFAPGTPRRVVSQ